jgi:hypothetical protein
MDTGHDVAGWEMYDANSKSGSVILGVSDKIAILIEASGIHPNALLEIVSNLDFDKMDKLSNASK